MVAVVLALDGRVAPTDAVAGGAQRTSAGPRDVGHRRMLVEPRKSALLSLFKAARVRLAAKRIAPATQEINQISDDLRDAKDSSSSHDRVDAATTLGKPANPEAALPIAVTAGADLRAANSKAPDTPIQIDKGTLVNLPTEVGEDVQWRGDYNALAPQREIAAFVSQLAALGYSLGESEPAICVGQGAHHLPIVASLEIQTSSPC